MTFCISIVPRLDSAPEPRSLRNWGRTFLDALISGASGFVGPRIVRHFLKLGHRVGVIVRPGSNLAPLAEAGGKIECFIHDGKHPAVLEAVRDFNPSIVIHTATHEIRPAKMRAVL